MNLTTDFLVFTGCSRVQWACGLFKGFPSGSVVKISDCNAGEAGDVGSNPESGRAPGGGHGNPLQYSCLENPMDRGAWQSTVQRVTKSQTQLKWHSCGLLFCSLHFSFLDIVLLSKLIRWNREREIQNISEKRSLKNYFVKYISLSSSRKKKTRNNPKISKLVVNDRTVGVCLTPLNAFY